MYMNDYAEMYKYHLQKSVAFLSLSSDTIQQNSYSYKSSASVTHNCLEFGE